MVDDLAVTVQADTAVHQRAFIVGLGARDAGQLAVRLAVLALAATGQECEGHMLANVEAGHARTELLDDDGALMTE